MAQTKFMNRHCAYRAAHDRRCATQWLQCAFAGAQRNSEFNCLSEINFAIREHWQAALPKQNLGIAITGAMPQIQLQVLSQEGASLHPHNTLLDSTASN